MLDMSNGHIMLTILVLEVLCDPLRVRHFPPYHSRLDILCHLPLSFYPANIWRVGVSIRMRSWKCRLGLCRSFGWYNSWDVDLGLPPQYRQILEYSLPSICRIIDNLSGSLSWLQFR